MVTFHKEAAASIVMVRGIGCILVVVHGILGGMGFEFVVRGLN